MLANEVINGEKIILRDITLDDCNDKYCYWMNDEETNHYLETRWDVQTVDSIMCFVEEKRLSKDSILFAIIDKIKEQHIGNIKIGPIDKNNKFAHISYFIGEESARGHGMATEAVGLAVDYAFNKLKLHRLHAGVIQGNEASKLVLQNNGFLLEGILKERSYYPPDVFLDVFLYGIIND